MKTDFSIELYTDKYKDDFKRINVEWLDDMFVAEPYDLKVLSDPQEYILNRKGVIYLAIRDSKAVGTCAIMEIEKGMFELTKMAVLKSERGMGTGTILLKHIINEVFDTKKQTYFLLTNKKCESAIHLYEKYGFKHDKDILDRFGSYYERANVGMLFKP